MPVVLERALPPVRASQGSAPQLALPQQLKWAKLVHTCCKEAPEKVFTQGEAVDSPFVPAAVGESDQLDAGAGS